MKLSKVSAWRGLVRAAFLLYAALVLKVVWFRHPAGVEALSAERLQFRLLYATNLTPLKTILSYLSHYQESRAALWNLGGNLALLAPLGFLLPLVFQKVRTTRHVAAAALSASLLLEVVQLLVGLGSFDVDDLLLNVVGAMLGWLVYWGGARLFSRGKESTISGAN